MNGADPALAAAARLHASHEAIAHSVQPRSAGSGGHPWLLAGAALAGVLLVSRTRLLKPALVAGLLTPAAGRWALRAALTAWLRRSGAPR